MSKKQPLAFSDDRIAFSDDRMRQPNPRVMRVLQSMMSSLGGEPMSFEEQQSIAQMLVVNGALGVRTIVGGDAERARAIILQIVDAALASTGGDVGVRVVDPGPTPPGGHPAPKKSANGIEDRTAKLENGLRDAVALLDEFAKAMAEGDGRLVELARKWTGSEDGLWLRVTPLVGD